MRSRRLSLAFVCLAGLASATGAVAAKPADEPFFPRAGNDGYNALAYRVSLGFKPKSGRIKAETAIEAAATEPLKRFSFDFFGPRVSGVEVGGQPVDFRRRPGKLIVSAAAQIAAGEASPRSSATAACHRRSPTPTAREEGWIPDRRRGDRGRRAAGDRGLDSL